MEEENVKIPKHIWDTVCSDEAYFDRHTYLRAEKYTNNHDAWYALERERESYGLQPRFSSFEIFKQARYRYVLEKLGRK